MTEKIWDERKTMRTQIDESTKKTPSRAAAGAAVYSKLLLSIYDMEVLRFELPCIFKCPLREARAFFDRHVSGVHLDVGVGTGYFLDKCVFPVENPTVHLMDLNPNTLEKTSRRIERYKPKTHLCNVLEPIGIDMPEFESISLFNFFHCLPGTMRTKKAVIGNLLPFLRKGGVFFGTTILGQGVDAGRLYRMANAAYNRKAIFSNLRDNARDLEDILNDNFNDARVRVRGSVAFFRGRK
jgi:hypothetical protein